MSVKRCCCCCFCFKIGPLALLIVLSAVVGCGEQKSEAELSSTPHPLMSPANELIAMGREAALDFIEELYQTRFGGELDLEPKVQSRVQRWLNNLELQEDRDEDYLAYLLYVCVFEPLDRTEVPSHPNHPDLGEILVISPTFPILLLDGYPMSIVGVLPHTTTHDPSWRGGSAVVYPFEELREWASSHARFRTTPLARPADPKKAVADCLSRFRADATASEVLGEKGMAWMEDFLRVELGLADDPGETPVR